MNKKQITLQRFNEIMARAKIIEREHDEKYIIDGFEEEIRVWTGLVEDYHVLIKQMSREKMLKAMWEDHGQKFNSLLPKWWLYYVDVPAWAYELKDKLYFHGGITWEERLEADKYRLGCDFHHCFDEGKDYSLEDVLFEIVKTIMSILYIKPVMSALPESGSHIIPEAGS